MLVGVPVPRVGLIHADSSRSRNRIGRQYGERQRDQRIAALRIRNRDVVLAGFSQVLEQLVGIGFVVAGGSRVGIFGVLDRLGHLQCI